MLVLGFSKRKKKKKTHRWALLEGSCASVSRSHPGY